MARQKKRKPSPPQRAVAKKNVNGRLKKLIVFLVSSGILLSLLATTYQYLVGKVSLEFIQPIGRAYEFQLKNDTPSDRTVKFFRIDPPHTQNVIYKITEDVYANINDHGAVTLPGGNVSYVSAAEFKELDGQSLPAYSSLKFRIPPLSSRPWMAPEATIVYIRYDLESSNPALSVIEKYLDTVRLLSHETTVRYLVIENYWTVSRSSSVGEAIRVFCRDNECRCGFGVFGACIRRS